MIPPEPLFFGPPMRPRFGWIHRPASGDARAGLIICNPFGYEAVCAHRSRVAQAAARGAALGAFDYDGTGRLGRQRPRSQRLTAWVTSIRDAIDTLRALGGASSASSCSACAWGARAGGPRRPGLPATWTASSRSRRWFLAARTCGSCARCKCRSGIAAPPIGHTPSADEPRGRGVPCSTPETLESVGQHRSREEGHPAGAPGPAPRTRRSALAPTHGRPR